MAGRTSIFAVCKGRIDSPAIWAIGVFEDLVERHVKWRKRKDRLVLHDHTGSAAIVLGAIRIRRNDYPFKSTRRQPARFALASLAAFFCLCNPGAAPFTVQGPGV